MTQAAVLDADVGVVGAGPGGLAAAVALARAGAKVVVLDEGHRAGGQIFRQPPPGAATGGHPEAPSHDRGHELLAAFAGSGAELCSGATVWDAAPGRLWFEQHGASRLLRCRDIVLAAGAYDRCVPFPGWTLPGVITAGAAQVMVRGFGVAPGRRALVAGSGPLLLPTVTALLAAGVEVVAALEAVSRWRVAAALPRLLGHGGRRREALYYLGRLWRAGVALRCGWTVLGVEGDGRVERARIGPVDAAGRPRAGRAQVVEVDVVAAGFGLVPAIELGQRLGCGTRFDPASGAHVLAVDAVQRTTVAAVWSVGEGNGIGGAEVAIAEGELAAAAIAAAGRGGAVPDHLRRRARRERRAAGALLRTFAPLPGLAALAEPGTIVCRCEDVTLAAARLAAELHGDSLRAIKLGCRAGMGPCQGRICSPMLQALACGAPGRAPDAPAVQVPVKPVSTATIVGAPPG